MSENLVIGLIAYVAMFLILFIYYLIWGGWIKRPKKKDPVEEYKISKAEKQYVKDVKTGKAELRHLTEVKFLIFKYNLDWRYLYQKRLLFAYAFLDSTIIFGILELILYLEWNFLFKAVLCFVLFLGLIYSLYSILGKILIKRGYEIDEHTRNRK